jgi:hypothetical protein
MQKQSFVPKRAFHNNTRALMIYHTHCCLRIHGTTKKKNHHKIILLIQFF